MMKAKTRLRAPLNSLLETQLTQEYRSQWDKKLYDFKTFEMAEDRSKGRIAYTFYSPVKPMVSDRDFYCQ
jgi:hypothetical protein